MDKINRMRNLHSTISLYLCMHEEVTAVKVLKLVCDNALSPNDKITASSLVCYSLFTCKLQVESYDAR